MAGRAFFRGDHDPGRLVLDNVNAGDQAVYKCRVDFRKAPTRIFDINLDIVGEYISLIKRRNPISEKSTQKLLSSSLSHSSIQKLKFKSGKGSSFTIHENIWETPWGRSERRATPEKLFSSEEPKWVNCKNASTFHPLLFSPQGFFRRDLLPMRTKIFLDKVLIKREVSSLRGGSLN